MMNFQLFLEVVGDRPAIFEMTKEAECTKNLVHKGQIRPLDMSVINGGTSSFTLSSLALSCLPYARLRLIPWATHTLRMNA